MAEPTNDTAYKPFVPQSVTMSEFTLRAVIPGLIMTLVLGAANAYLGLRAGQTIAATYPAAVISMAILRIRKGSILEENLARHDSGGGREQSQQRERQGRLPGARLAHDAERLALVEGQADVVHGARDPGAPGAHVVRGQVPDVEERTGHNWRSCGSNFTRSQSPRRFADRTISMMHEPGRTVSHQ